MNFFSGDDFLAALAEVYFPGRPWRIGLFSLGGATYRLLEVDGRVITHWRFLDLVEPVEEQSALPAAPLGYLPKALQGIVSAEEWQARPAEQEFEPCPFIDWSRFPEWEAYAARLPQRETARRRRRMLEREVGPLRFEEDDRRREVLRACLGWKSAQYRTTGLEDLFAEPRNVRLFETLADRSALKVSSLAAGERLVAAHLCPRWPKRWSSWIPAYDPGSGRYAPGRLLLDAMLECSFRAGDREFDFLIGDEPYKFGYATHVRVAGPLGTPPLLLALERRAKRQLKRALGQVPWLDARVRAVRRALASTRRA